MLEVDERTSRPGARRNRRRGPLLLLALLLGLPGTGDVSGQQSGTTISTAEFRERLDRRLADTALGRALTGVSVVRVRDSVVVAERNAGALLHPGSNMKLFTTGAALAILAPDSRFRTSVWCDADIDGGDLAGSLYVVGGGDPLLDTADVDSIAGMAAAAGIRRIEGDIVADLSLFDTLGWGRGWMWDDEPDPDEAFITPLYFDGGTVSVITAPGTKEGDGLSCRLLPPNGYFGIDDSSTTLPRNATDSAVVTRARGFDRIVVRGGMALGSPPETTVFSVRYPAAHFLHELRRRLIARGIEVDGVLRTGGVTGPVRLGAIEHNIGEAVSRINKLSDNPGAECLLKSIAARLTGEAGTAEAGLQAVGAYAAGFGVASGSTILADGSGVSWYNAVAPSDITALLLDQHARTSTFRAFYASLPRAGYDGTLAGRMKGTAAAGRVAAKTGTLTGVSALSGYVTTLSNELLAFSIVVNHFPGRPAQLRALQDAILQDLVVTDTDR